MTALGGDSKKSKTRKSHHPKKATEKNKKFDNEGNNRIIGGEVATEGEFPFFVDFGGCGASLIYEDIVVTAAHCAIVLLEQTSDVYVGAFREQWDEGATEEKNGSEKRQVVTSRVHPDYDDFTLLSDVMVMKINEPSSHPPVALNGDSDKPQAGDDFVVIGHGITDVNNPYDTPDELHKVTVPFVSHEECVADLAAFDDVDLPELVEDVMFCAGFEEGGKDSCQGDSGGPLLAKVGDEYIQMGITSWGNECALPNSPGVYTRISAVKDWIDEQICALSSNPPSGCPEKGEKLNSHFVKIPHPERSQWTAVLVAKTVRGWSTTKTDSIIFAFSSMLPWRAQRLAISVTSSKPGGPPYFNVRSVSWTIDGE